MNKPKFKVGDKVNRKLLKKYWEAGDFIGTIESINDEYYLFGETVDEIRFCFNRSFENELEFYRPIVYSIKKMWYSVIRWKINPRKRKNKKDRNRIALKVFLSFLSNPTYSKETIIANDIDELIKHSISIAEEFTSETNKNS